MADESGTFPSCAGRALFGRHSSVVDGGSTRCRPTFCRFEAVVGTCTGGGRRECGLDRLRGADLEIQTALFRRQVELAEERGLPVTVHCVKAFDRLLHLCKLWRPKTQWTVHGFRGGPELAVQLLAAGIDLSFGRRYNPETLKVVSPERCHFETDEA